MNFQTITVREDGPVLYATINNPPINLMSIQMVQELFQLSGYLRQAAHLKVAVMDSADPDFFIAHFDLHDMEASATDPSKASRYPDMNALQSLGLNWQSLPQVTIARIDGRIRGGGLEFAQAFDMRFATQRSLFSFPEASGHFLASGGGTTRTVLAAGPSRALEFLLSARDFTAEEVERYGLINRALSEDEIDAYLGDLIGRITRRSREVVAMHRAVIAQVTAPFVEPVFAGLAAENEGMRQALAIGHLQEGVAKHIALGQTRENELDLPAALMRLNTSN
jgi:enoyl-CoA hydratase/carnithine racemase